MSLAKQEDLIGDVEALLLFVKRCIKNLSAKRKHDRKRNTNKLIFVLC